MPYIYIHIYMQIPCNCVCVTDPTLWLIALNRSSIYKYTESTQVCSCVKVQILIYRPTYIIGLYICFIYNLTHDMYRYNVCIYLCMPTSVRTYIITCMM